MNRSTTTTGAKRHSSLTNLARANSAQANLQSHPCFQSSLFSDKERAAGSLKAWKERNQNVEKNKDLESLDGIKSNIKRDYELENIIWTQSVKQSRRMTLGNTQNISDWEITLLKRQKSYAVSALGELKGKLEEKLNLNALHDLNLAFLEADADGSGTLELDEFKEVVKNALKIHGRNDEEIAALFMKINFSSDGRITWDEFCTFMQLNFSEKEDTTKRKKEVVFNLPAKSESNPHRTAVQRVSCTSDQNFMVMSADGITSFWGPAGDIKRIRREIIEKRIFTKDKGDKQDTKRQRPRWITDFIILNELNKILIGTGDRELQFWELSSFEPYCQICSLPTVPIKLAYCFDRDKGHVTITYGDTDGCVNILIFYSIGETLRLWKTSPVIAQMPTIHLDKALEGEDTKEIKEKNQSAKPKVIYVRWKTHNDWVEQIRIDPRLNQIISCSNDEVYALIIGCILPSTDVNSHMQNPNITSHNSDQHGNQNQSSLQSHNPGLISHTSFENINPKRQSIANRTATPNLQAKYNNTISKSSREVKRRPEGNETIFRVNKGVKTFDFSFEKNLLITGGMDRIVRLYNPYVPSRPIAHLKSHTTPIFYIHLSNEDNRIFSISNDKCLNVWDLIDHSCLASIRPKSHKITGELQACCYNSKLKSILISTDKISFLSLKLKANLHTEIVLSHKEPVVCCMFNKQFKQLVSCSEGGNVKLWDVETGRDLFEFSNAHGDYPITCMTFDDSGRRLITGGRDGQCKVWNFNNGHCLKILTKDNNLEVTDVKYTKIYNNKFIINVGWDRRINIYDDDINDVRLLLNPNPRWSDEIENGHREDIMCLAKSESNFLATSSYDGEIIIWNMVSGHVFTKLYSPKPKAYEDDNLDGDLNVNKMIFMNKERYNDKNSTHMISSGPWGMIHFWTIFNGASILARFPVSDKRGTNITRMIVDSRFGHLFASDNFGYIYHYNIEKYATNGPESYSPTLVKCWRAHVQSVTSLEYIETSRIVISTSSDCTIRVWKPDGKYIGTFGQDEIWNLYDSKTFKHPLVPYDILVDNQSMPEHPILSTRETFQEVLESNLISDKMRKEQEKSTRKLNVVAQAVKAAKIISNIKNYMIDDDTIMEQIKNMSVPKKVGKRLRHEITKPMPIVVDKNKNYYQMLKCFEYDPLPTNFIKPSSALKKSDKIFL